MCVTTTSGSKVLLSQCLLFQAWLNGYARGSIKITFPQLTYKENFNNSIFKARKTFHQGEQYSTERLSLTDAVMATANQTIHSS